MKKTVISVEFEFPGQLLKCHDFYSEQSLLDGDIVVFEPDIRGYELGHSYSGKPCLYEHDSFRLQECSQRWQRELRTALTAGKTVFWFLREKLPVYVYTGDKQFSGTGRSRVTTNIVTLYDNYQSLPLTLGAIEPARGNVIVPYTDLGPLTDYWKDLGPLSHYECYIDALHKESKLVTKTGKRTVGGVFPIGQGWLVLLPPFDLTGAKYISKGKWTPEAVRLGHKLLNHFVAIDQSLRKSGLRTPPPSWSTLPEYSLERAVQIESELELLKARAAEVAKERDERLRELEQVNTARHLLYEQGRLLQDAVLEALRLMGFVVSSLDDGESEFDAVFESPEGRMLGEVEGKDSSALNIDKLSQLERNIQEDFQKEGTKHYAKGVLFGNAYRLSPVPDRSNFFTEKCLKGAQRAGVALVRTPDLFRVVRYLRTNQSDAHFKTLCRAAIVGTSGEVVVFPPTPDFDRDAVPYVVQLNDKSVRTENHSN